MVYCGLVSPHRSVEGDQVTLTAPRVGSANETMIEAPTAAREVGTKKLAQAEDMKASFAYIFCIFSITVYSNTCRGSINSHTFAGCHWLPAAEGTISTNSYPYIVLLPHCEACDDQW